MEKNISQIITNNDDIKEINYNFEKYRQKHDTFFENKEHEMEIRYQNIQDVITILNKYNIEHWLQGKTMLGISKYKKLFENDTDEDIGLDHTNILKICKEVIPELIKKGFKIIRATRNNSMLTVMRNCRYIDLCFFRIDGDKYYYEKKIFPKYFYDNIIKINVNGFEYNIPEKYKDIIKYSYNE